MKPLSGWAAATPALAGIAAGLTVIALSHDALAIGATLLGVGLFAYLRVELKKWMTDTTYEKSRLRSATLTADEAREQYSTGRTLQLAERERHRSEHAEAMRQAADAIRTEQARADQRIIDQCAALNREAAEQDARVRTECYRQGVLDTLSGQIEQIAEPANVFRLPDRRQSQADDGPASGTEGRRT
jgi:hypothetical protein